MSTRAAPSRSTWNLRKDPRASTTSAQRGHASTLRVPRGTQARRSASAPHRSPTRALISSRSTWNPGKAQRERSASPANTGAHLFTFHVERVRNSDRALHIECSGGVHALLLHVPRGTHAGPSASTPHRSPTRAPSPLRVPRGTNAGLRLGTRTLRSTLAHAPSLRVPRGTHEGMGASTPHRSPTRARSSLRVPRGTNEGLREHATQPRMPAAACSTWNQ